VTNKRNQRSAATNGQTNGTLRPTRPLLMKARAYQEIKAFIQRGDFAPGSLLAERQLAAQLGMSKTPVRAALVRLEAEGFINISPQQGILIRDLTVAEIVEQYEIRTALETYVVRTLAGRLSPDQVARLRVNLRAQKALPENAPVARGVALDSEFHMLFCEFLGNREILGLMDQLREKIARVITTVFKFNPLRVKTSYEEHRAIAEAVIGGDGATAARLIDQHLEIGKQLLLSPRRC
jgi:DNA-binding GntR family transcriptional regulator